MYELFMWQCFEHGGIPPAECRAVVLCCARAYSKRATNTSQFDKGKRFFCYLKHLTLQRNCKLEHCLALLPKTTDALKFKCAPIAENRYLRLLNTKYWSYTRE